MLVVLGSALAVEPWALAREWAALDVGVLTPADLSRPGWRHRPGDGSGEARGGHRETVVVDGATIPAAAIEGVVATMPFVDPRELTHIVEPDRDYVAAEMTAFLLAWLAALPCPVIDRPSPTALDGCGRRPWQWIALARELGIAAPAPPDEGPGETIDVTVVGVRAVDAPARPLARAAERLADAASRKLVTLRFRDAHRPAFHGVRNVPAVGSPAVAEALLGWMRS